MFKGTATEESLQRGRVKWFNEAKGYGFITPEDGTQDVFFHYSVIAIKGFKTIAENQLVDFATTTTDDNKTQASKVQIALI